MLTRLILLGFLCGWLYAGGDEGALLASKLAVLKSTAHRSLTATKDVTPLVGRIDKDLLVLEAKKRSLIEEKNFLLQRREALQLSLCDKQSEHDALLAEQRRLEVDWEQSLGQLRSFLTQQSIQPASQEVAQSVSRATLLAQIFEQKIPFAVQGAPLAISGGEDLRG